MVNFMLNDLRRPAGECFNARLELFILPLHLDGLITLCFPRAGQGQAALLRLVGLGPFENLRCFFSYMAIVAEKWKRLNWCYSLKGRLISVQNVLFHSL